MGQPTPMTQEEYLAAKGTLCPKCRQRCGLPWELDHGPNVAGDWKLVKDEDYGRASGSKYCGTCGMYWTESYVLIGYSLDSE